MFCSLVSCKYLQLQAVSRGHRQRVAGTEQSPQNGKEVGEEERGLLKLNADREVVLGCEKRCPDTDEESFRTGSALLD